MLCYRNVLEINIAQRPRKSWLSQRLFKINRYKTYSIVIIVNCERGGIEVRISACLQAYRNLVMISLVLFSFLSSSLALLSNFVDST